MGRPPQSEQRRRELQERFLAAFAHTGVIMMAVRESGIRTGHYKWMKNDSEYAKRFRQLQQEVAALTVQNRNLGGLTPGFVYPEGHSKVKRRREQQDRLIAAVEKHKLLGKAVKESGVSYSNHIGWMHSDLAYADRYNVMLEDIKAARKIALTQAAFTMNARREMTFHEKIVNEELKRTGIEFFPQNGDNGRYALDFYVPSFHLDIEVDSKMHTSGTEYRLSDTARDEYLIEKGYTIIRIEHSKIDDGSFIPILRHALHLDLQIAVVFHQSLLGASSSTARCRQNR